MYTIRQNGSRIQNTNLKNYTKMRRVGHLLKLIATSCIMLVQLNGVTAQEVAKPQKKSHEKRYIRLIALADPFAKNHWMANKAHGLAKDYTAQDILEMIEELNPDCLERFITGYPDPDGLVPVREGCEPMTVMEFLNAAILAGGEGCHIIPKLNLQWLQNDRGAAYFWRAAELLYKLPLVKPIRNINLDVWDIYCKEIDITPKERARLFKRLRKIGYEEIGVNLTGLYRVNDPQLDYADFNIDKHRWEINRDALNMLKGYPNLKEYFMYIDYPGAMDAFRLNSPDRQAQIYSETIYPAQAELGFTFVYPIIQDSWDASAVSTSKDGPYKGKTMYEITKELLDGKK